MATLFLAEGFDSTEFTNNPQFAGLSSYSLVTGFAGRGNALDQGSAPWDSPWTRTTYRYYGMKFRPSVTSGYVIGDGNWDQFPGDINWRVSFNATDYIIERVGGSQVAVAAGARTGGWDTIEVQASNNNASNLRLRINGVDYLTSGTYDCSQHNGFIGLWNDGDYDDLVILDSPATDMSDMLGSVAVSRIIPDGNGTYTGWTGDYLDVDNDPVDTLTSVTAASASLKETFTMSSLPATADSVDLVVAELTYDGDRAFWPLFATSGAGSEARGTQITAPGAPARTVEGFFTNPITASAWTPSEIGSYEFGVESA